ncbi:MAG TPA: branched-chain amino acid ABC transporter permease [Stackebrandtia sp.]|nr:branched-chain amino acid ABC transporter permease [Stackebrandtia sp.]HZE41777.1 branched-chain amino acid ABC transporter permease [Stackebrandtia sp.]
MEGLSGMRRRWRALPTAVRWLTLLAVVVVFYSLPILNEYFVFPINYISTDIVPNGTDFDTALVATAIFVLVAVGLNVVIGLAGMLDLGYIGFFAVGAYTVALFGSAQSDLYIKLPHAVVPYRWVMLVLIGIALAMMSGVILGVPTLRLRGDYLAIVTLGFGEIIRLIAVNSTFTNGQQGIDGVPNPPGHFNGEPLFGVVDSRPMYWLCLTIVIICIFGVRRLENSRVGRAWLAVREDEDAAGIMGVAAFKFKIWAFAIGAAVGGLSGALYASRGEGYVNSDGFPLQLSILFVAMVVLGGQGNTAGVILGAVVITYLPERLREIKDERFMWFGVALVIIMIFRPQGLLPSRRRAAEMADMKAEAKEVSVSG